MEEFVLRSRIVVRGIVGVIIQSAVLLTRPYLLPATLQLNLLLLLRYPLLSLLLRLHLCHLRDLLPLHIVANSKTNRTLSLTSIAVPEIPQLPKNAH